MKQEFLNFLNALMAAAPDVAEELMTDNIRVYIETLTNSNVEKSEITDNGKIILDYLQKNPASSWKARDIAEGLFISSRSVSGTLRGLVNNNFLEKIGETPSVYVLTEKGKNYKIDN